MKKETEIKIELGTESFLRLKKILFDLGARQVSSFNERTYGFFTPDRKSIKEGIFPRIKVFNKNKEGILTVKIKKQKKTKYFQRNEFSLLISNVKNARDVLCTLGYSKERIFDKKREIWKFKKKDIEICLDKLPFGNYVEIEGKPKEIEKTIKKLKLERYKRITKAYLAVYDEWRKKNNVKSENAIFE